MHLVLYCVGEYSCDSSYKHAKTGERPGTWCCRKFNTVFEATLKYFPLNELHVWCFVYDLKFVMIYCLLGR